MSRSVLVLLLVASAIAVVNGQTAAPLTGAAAVLAEMKAGGTVIVMRHGATFQDQADVDPLNIADCSKQRQLNQAGRAGASTVGVLLSLNGVSLVNVTTSKYCRAIETGSRVAEPFGLTLTSTLDISESGQVVSPNENKRRIAAMQAAANSAPAAPANAFLVSHKPNIVDAFGGDFLNIGEGEMVVFRPSATGAVAVGRIKIPELVTLSKK